jgi:eukaryotic-like serine/threonine-protein kinase
MSDESLVGQTIAGKYRVETILGKGGMGLVLGARHLKLDEPVAIKILRSAMMEVDGMVSRFLREARAASKIKSEHVVRVTDVDTRDDGVPYMVMEHLTGQDLAEVRKEKGAIDVAVAVGWVLEACDAIAEAHEIGIVHRDLKPSNLFLHTRRDGRRVVKVLDFGISKVDAPGEQDTTKTGQMMGSPKYMSPEQMTSMRDVDGRSDIWSLGAILFDLLCGRPPFVAETTPRICALVLNADPPLPSSLRPEIPHELEMILLRCLDKDPDRRFEDVPALVAALSAFAPPADRVASSARPVVASAAAPRASDPPKAPELKALPSVTPTPSSPGPTVAAWDTTRHEGPPKKKGGSRRTIAIAAGVVVLGGVAAIYALGREAPPPPVTASAVEAPSSAPVVDSVPTVTTAAAIQPAVSPNDLPDVDPAKTAQPTPRAVPHPAAAPATAKKPKAPPSDPFGGRRN